eukprot:7733233-Alexandrium_andersonii.AAC.1
MLLAGSEGGSSANAFGDYLRWTTGLLAKGFSAAFGGFGCGLGGGGRRTPGGWTPGNARAPRGPRGAWAGGWCRR